MSLPARRNDPGRIPPRLESIPGTGGEAPDGVHVSGPTSADDETRAPDTAYARRLARREHVLQSLVELGRELTVSLDLHQTADLLLFNLMGQLGSSCSAMWLLAKEEPARPVLVRCHGFDRRMIEVAGTAFASTLQAHFSADSAPVLAAADSPLGAADRALANQAEIVLLAPLVARDKLLGWLALGPRLDRAPVDGADQDVLGAALGMVAVSLQNAYLYNDSLESNRRLRVANEHLEELDRLKSEFFSNLNHELRTPLALVLGTLEIVRDGATSPADARELLGMAHERAQQLRVVIENLLTFSDATHRKLSVQPVVTDVTAMLEAYHRRRQPGVSAGLRELVWTPGGGPLVATVDPARVEQILDQLVDNAVKFTPHGTRIQLRARVARDGERDWTVVEMADDGPGIRPDRVDSIFNAFEQVDGSSTRSVGGLGMGLALARQLAQRMGGSLEAQSQLGRGSTFSLMLPRA